jgi:multiple sugar transport system substrate-binding protein
MGRITRRKLLQCSGAGIAAILAAHRAPVFAQASTVHILRGTDFIPAGDKVWRENYPLEAQKALGIKLNFEAINTNDIPARATAAIQSGNGPDILALNNNYPHLYAAAAVDVSSVANEVNKSGGIPEALAQLNKVDGKWVAVPYAVAPTLIVYRKSWFEEAGATSFPKTWLEYHQIGKRLKANKRPIGQSLGNTWGDAPNFTYPLLWSFGGQELDAKGKVVLNSPATLESLRFMAQFWKDAHDEGGLAWDDTNNNRAFLSGDISATLNAASIYISALNAPDKFKTEKGAPLHADCLHAPLPAGPKGAHSYHTVASHMVMKYSKNTQAALELLRWLHQRENYEKWFVVHKGYVVGPTRDWEDHPMWKEDPAMASFRTAPQAQTRLMGFAGQPDKHAAEAWNKYIVTVMYAQACSGKLSPEESVKWATGELSKVYN